MKRENVLTTVGVCLLAACFLVALVRILGRERAVTHDGKIVIRFAHWQLEGGLRDAFDQLARHYEQLHPGVRVEQIAIPERTYPQWIRTQLIGGTAPDIIELGLGSDIEIVARFFTPITEYVRQPNPYNEGTPLAGLPWRETVIDGMTVAPSYQSELLENYGAPVSMFTIRMYCNRDLWLLVLGDTPPPATYDEFLALFPRIDDYNVRTGSRLLPIAGSKLNAGMLISALLQNQTQRLVQEKIAGPTLRVTSQEIGLRFLRGEWTLADPGYTDALTIAREVALHMPPGFSQLGREEATFYFVQGKALMITTGSWDSPSFRTQVGFDLDVFDIPLPTREHPRYGKNLLGHSSEAEIAGGLSFGITRQTPQFDVALDFLRFLTSHPGNTEFARLSGWLPSVIGVEPSAEMIPFKPHTDGYVPGFDFNFSYIGANAQRITDSTTDRLYSPEGSVDAFRSALASQLPEGIEADLRRSLRLSELNANRQDVVLVALRSLQARTGEETGTAAKLDALVEGQNGMDSATTWLNTELDQLAAQSR